MQSIQRANAVVYVDSGSTDGSVDIARVAGAAVCQLDLSVPFTAARARNEGSARLEKIVRRTEYIQFVDGDCELAGGWLDQAVTFLQHHPDVAAVCGRRRERHPERSIYNRLCDLEWDTPIGLAKSFGGDVLIRSAALQQVGGYRDELIAGEEPELCVRLRARGWKIWRLDAEMTLHDAGMTRIGQWWMRCVRAGFAYAEGARLHGAPPERHWVRECRSAWLWGAALPLAIVLSALVVSPACWLGLALYPLQMARVAWRLPQRGSIRWLRAFFLVAGKFPEAQGLLKAWLANARRQRAVLIEYK